jgi:hypothetical protein
MAFVTLRRSRNTRSYYLVESYRNEQGRPSTRTLCYLGREQDGTDTLVKALSHWEQVMDDARRRLATAQGERQRVLKDRVAKAGQRTALLRLHLDKADRIEAENRRRAEEAEHWQAIERLHHVPSAEHAQAAKRAFRILSLHHHPDQGGSHEAFIRLKAAYDDAAAAWRRHAG